ncbi:MAG: DEAD/DEAH box helicase, partial [Candidatus Krumholzibacteriia bacterium]
MPAQLLEIALPVPLPRTFSYRHEPAEGAARRRVQAGDLVVVPFGRRREVIGLVTAAGPLADGAAGPGGVVLRAVARVLGPEYRIAGERLRLARWLAGYYMLPLGEVVPLFHPPAPGTAARGEGEDAGAYPDVDAGPVVLTPDQRAALAAAGGPLARGEFTTVLLHGVTGSGKTEVYLALIEQALALGRSALYLLPEIALTPQTLARITQRFGARAAAIHSSLSAGERCRVHEAAASGEVSVVVG